MPSAHRYNRYCGSVWRMVEGQHIVSTMRLVDSLAEQAILEGILDRSKPPMPEECRHLHYLMATPFRYGCYPESSRFRRKGETPGVFYASEAAVTAAAETVWSRLRFFDAAPDAILPEGAAGYTAFSCAISTGMALDLMRPPMLAGRAQWSDPDDYSHCLDLADTARTDGAGAIRYESVRDPGAGANLAVLRCDGFAAPAPLQTQSWRIALRPGGAFVLREFPEYAVELRRDGHRLARVA